MEYGKCIFDGDHLRSEAKPALLPLGVWNRALYFASTRKIVDYLRAYPDAPTNLATLSGVACMERTSLSRSFRRRTGVTLQRFIQAYRISKAMEFIAASDCSITEISLNLGFNSLSTFESTFKRFVGKTPSEYRLHILNRSRSSRLIS